MKSQFVVRKDVGSVFDVPAHMIPFGKRMPLGAELAEVTASVRNQQKCDNVYCTFKIGEFVELPEEEDPLRRYAVVLSREEYEARTGTPVSGNFRVVCYRTLGGEVGMKDLNTGRCDAVRGLSRAVSLDSILKIKTW